MPPSFGESSTTRTALVHFDAGSCAIYTAHAISGAPSISSTCAISFSCAGWTLCASGEYRHG
jgi:hypothetical protein